MIKMKKKNNITFYLNDKEEQVMRVLWKAEQPMSATEIANEINTVWAKKSIRNIIRKLESKKAIEVAEIAKIQKTYGRLFRATISSNEYAMMQFEKFYDRDREPSFLLSALTEDKNSAFSEDLKKLMEKYKTK